MSKEFELTKRAERLIKRAEELGLTEEQKHIDSEDSPEKEYWHYGYAVAITDICRNFNLKEIKIDQVGAEVIKDFGRQRVQEATWIGHSRWRLLLSCGHTVIRTINWYNKRNSEQIISEHCCNCDECKK